MGDETFDLLVVGGGVCGVAIARDAALRGYTVALVEKNDFAHATSAASSKLIHGGLRYLKNFELSLVRESLRERRTWTAIAGHLVTPLSFMLPNYSNRPGSSQRWLLRIGLTLYDLLSYDRNQLRDEDRKLPAHRVLDADEALRQVPGLDAHGLRGAVQYWDCQMFSPERLALECALDAARHGARLANWAEVESLRIEGGQVRGATVVDALGGPGVEIKARTVVNATGPWADRLMPGEAGSSGSPKIVRSKGIHVITRDLTGDTAVAFEGEHGHFFILPWRGHSLIGTTDTVYEGDPDAFAVTESDIEAFLRVINAGMPSAALQRQDVLHFYGGLRPLVESDPGGDSYSASRRSEVVDHGVEGGPRGMFSALGGKWTTARAVAEQVVDAVGTAMASNRPCTTHDTPMPGGGFETWAKLLEELAARHPELDREVIEHLARHYGTRADAVMALADKDPALAEPIAPGRLERRAEVVFATRDEMARTLGDVVFRRTGLGTLGDPGPAALQTVATLMAEALGWSAAQQQEQIRQVQARFVPRGDDA